MYLAEGRGGDLKVSRARGSLWRGNNGGELQDYALGLVEVIPRLEGIDGYAAEAVDQLLAVFSLGLLSKVCDDVVKGEGWRPAPLLAPRQLVQELLDQAPVQQRQRVQEHPRNNLELLYIRQDIYKAKKNLSQVVHDVGVVAPLSREHGSRFRSIVLEDGVEAERLQS